MAKYHRNNVDTLTLNRIPSSSSSSTSGNTFSGSTFRRIIFDAISCGGSSRYKRNLREDSDGDDKYQTFPTKPNVTTLASEKKLCDLLNLPEMKTSVVEETTKKKKEETLEILKLVVRDLQAETAEDDGEDKKKKKKTAAASEVRSLAKDDTEARVTLAMLGAIPPLVKMIDDDGDDEESSSEDSRVASLYALLNIGIGNDANKEAIVKAGAVQKMMKLIDSCKPLSQAISEAIIANFLGLSALDSNKPIIGSSGAIIFLAKTLKSLESPQAKEDTLRALYNLSIHSQNVSLILETDLVPFMLNTLGDMEVSERILAILANVVSVSEGRRTIGGAVEAFPILVDVLNWNDSQKCQEKALYILMLMAHKGYGERKAMIEAGIESSLLELTLVGSALVQKRASRILECLRVMDKGKQVSAPIYGMSTSSSSSLRRERCEIRISDERRAVKQLVQQSLQSNMKRIVKRANLPHDFGTSQHFTKSLTF